MNIQIDVEEILIDGVKVSESQLLDLRLALERELSGDRMQAIPCDQRSPQLVNHTSIEMRTNSSPQHLASGIATSILESFVSNSRCSKI